MASEVLQEDRGLLGTGGVLWEFNKAVIHAVRNHGGNDGHVSQLLKDPERLAMIGKIIVGTIWDLTENAVQVEVDWQIALREYQRTIPLDVAQQLLLTIPWTDEIPTPLPDGRYKLGHLPQPLTPMLAEAEFEGSNTLYRELLAYGTTVDLPEGFAVVALGSMVKDGEMPIYPCLRSSGQKKVIEWIGIKPGQTFKSEYFFLIRA